MHPPDNRVRAVQARIAGGLREIHRAQANAAQAQHLLFDAPPNRRQQAVQIIAA
ncbi:hypothetical protein [Sodalis glossinidius]|uniref:hypothetical protein n=1 Tax=Sodalis glossinidius TaxID=63612 RepID=UPI001FB0AEEE|nr:hypothetical protein [Sodalis glossinidius]